MSNTLLRWPTTSVPRIYASGLSCIIREVSCWILTNKALIPSTEIFEKGTPRRSLKYPWFIKFLFRHWWRFTKSEQEQWILPRDCKKISSSMPALYFVRQTRIRFILQIWQWHHLIIVYDLFHHHCYQGDILLYVKFCIIHINLKCN